MIKRLLLAAALVAPMAQAGDKILSNRTQTGVECIGGYLHSYVIYYGHGVSIQQLFEHPSDERFPPQPIKCKDGGHE